MEGYLTPEEIQQKRMSNQYGYNTPNLETEYSSATPAKIYGAGLESGSNNNTSALPHTDNGGYKDMAKGGVQAMNSGGGAGSALTSAGMYGLMAGTGGMAAPVALGAGMLLSNYEQGQKAKAMQEQLRVNEANDRKRNVQDALTQALSATRMLGV